MTKSFAGALLDPEAAIPEGVTDPQGRPSAARFNVYRNNVVSSLADALETGFPVLRKLVGDEFFRAMAQAFLRTHPPTSARLSGYGTQMPAFLEGFPPVAHLPYLADVARLELALRDSYHAADHAPLPPEAFAAIEPDALMERAFGLAPSTRLLRSNYPVGAIWEANTKVGTPKITQTGPQDIAVVRPEFDPMPITLLPGQWQFFTCMAQGFSFGAAVAAAEADASEFDLTAALQLAFQYHLFPGDPSNAAL